MSDKIMYQTWEQVWCAGSLRPAIKYDVPSPPKEGVLWQKDAATEALTMEQRITRNRQSSKGDER